MKQFDITVAVNGYRTYCVTGETEEEAMDNYLDNIHTELTEDHTYDEGVIEMSEMGKYL